MTEPAPLNAAEMLILDIAVIVAADGLTIEERRIMAPVVLRALPQVPLTGSRVMRIAEALGLAAECWASRQEHWRAEFFTRAEVRAFFRDRLARNHPAALAA